MSNIAIILPIVLPLTVPFILLFLLRFYSKKVWLYYAKTQTNEAIIQRCPTISKKSFNPTLYLQNGLLQTFFAALVPVQAKNDHYIVEEVQIPGGGQTSLAFAQQNKEYQCVKQSKFMVVIIPGLTGDIKDGYIRDLVKVYSDAGYRCVVYQPRFNGGKLKLPDEGNLDLVKDFKITMDYLVAKEKDVKLIAVGHSYGANLLVNYLGFHAEENNFVAGISLANPYHLLLSEAKLRNSIMDMVLTKFLRVTAGHNKKELSEASRFNLDIEHLKVFKGIRDFDKNFTMKVLGYENVNDYYWGISSCRRIYNIKIPLLLLQAADDPLVERRGYDEDDIQRHSPNTILMMTRCGGHQGWVEGFFFLRRWYFKPVLEYVNAIVALSDSKIM